MHKCKKVGDAGSSRPLRGSGSAGGVGEAKPIECKACGLLKSTIDSLHPEQRWYYCIDGRADHDFGDDFCPMCAPPGELSGDCALDCEHKCHKEFSGETLTDWEGEFVNLFPRHTEIQKQFISALLAKTRNRIKTDLLKIADEGEYEDMRREVERYFINDK